MGYKFGWRRTQFICALVSVAGILMIVLPFALQGFTQEGWRDFFSNLGFAMLLLSAGISSLLVTPHLRRRAQLFAAAFSSPIGDAPWAANQPMPSEAALTLPTNIRLRTRWPVALVWYGLFLVVFMVAGTGFTIGVIVLQNRLTGEPLASSFILIYIVVFIGLTCIMAMAIATSFLPLRLQTLHITEEGVAQTQARLRHVSAITWANICVFAVVEGRRRPGSAVTYMLSSGRRAVRWKYRSRTCWYSITAPTTSNEEYHRQMDALLSYIAARTSLPLFDLR